MVYIKTFIITLILSTVFSLAGGGGAAALIPIYNLLGFPFALSKAAGLFVNVTATSMSTVMNIKRKALDIKFAVPLLVTMIIFLPLGAYFSQYIDEKIMKWMLDGFLFFTATIMFFGKKEKKVNYKKKWILYVTGASVGLFSGIVGVSGGNLILAVLILLGYDPKKMVYVMSFIVPFSSFAAFLTYASMIHIDWILIAVTSSAALIGASIGNRIMFFKLNSRQIKKLVSVLLYIIAVKMAFSLI